MTGEERRRRQGVPERTGAERAEPVIVLGLSGRLLVLTVLFVMLAEVLIYVPSVANFRRNWLKDRLSAAQVAALVLEAVPAGGIQPGLEAKLLEGVGAYAVVVRTKGARRLLAMSEVPPEVAHTVDLREGHWATLIAEAFDTMLFPDARPMRVVGEGMGRAAFVEIIMDERPLRAAMLVFSRNILLLSLAISAIAAGLVYLALHLLIVRPVRRLAAGISSFEQAPEDAERITRPSGRRDEIGLVERALARMEATLAAELRQKKHLAALGLAVSKVNHDLRNMLAAAQLLSDRLSHLSDPTVKRFAPRLIATLGRAIDFCQATLAYGRAAEPAPRRRLVALRPLVMEVRALSGLAEDSGIAFVVDVPRDVMIDADPDQLSRVLLNLCRNAIQALTRAGASDGAPALSVAARREGAAVRITVADNGPGVPPQAREHLFEAFQGTTNAGGAGLGLAIAAELVQLHGGSIALDEGRPGATFSIIVPDRADASAA